MSQQTAPSPELIVLPMDTIFPHELHDSQRSIPLLERIRHSDCLINPPIVAPMGNSAYVILDGANRYHVLRELGYKTILVQIVHYGTTYVQLESWRHVISNWERVYLIEEISRIEGLELHRGWKDHALMRLVLEDGFTLSLVADSHQPAMRNALLCEIVGIYQRQAKLHRTTISNPAEIWSLYPGAIAVAEFRTFKPEEIIEAAHKRTFLPPGISRHIIHGRALRLNYPLAWLQSSASIDAKNEQLQQWLTERLSKRSIRYYAEGTYLFDE